MSTLWLLIPVFPIALWVAYGDLKEMKIRNRSVALTVLCFATFGMFALPFDAYMWRYTHLTIVLAIGFLANMAGLIGGGDAKYAAAIAPFFALADIQFVVFLFSAMLLAAYFTHRVFARIPAVLRATPDWASWRAGKKFPMGLALSGTLLFYLRLHVWVEFDPTPFS